MVNLNASMNPQFVELGSKCRSTVYVCAFQIAHEHLCICEQHAERYKQHALSEVVLDQKHPHLNVLPSQQSSQLTDLTHDDHKPLNEYVFFHLPLLSLLFAYIKTDILCENFLNTRHGK